MKAPMSLLMRRVLANPELTERFLYQIRNQGSWNQRVSKKSKSFSQERRDSQKILDKYCKNIESNLDLGNYNFAKIAFDDYVSFRDNNKEISTLNSDLRLQKVFDKYGVNWKL